jgi:hypothetical protein
MVSSRERTDVCELHLSEESPGVVHKMQIFGFHLQTLIQVIPRQNPKDAC